MIQTRVYSRLARITRAHQASHDRCRTRKIPLFSMVNRSRRRRSHVEASTLLDPTFLLVTRAMSTWLAVSKSRPIRDTRRPLPSRKVAEAPLSPRYARDRRTEGERSGEVGERVCGYGRREGSGEWGVKHHPPRAPKGTYVCGCMYHSYQPPPGGFPFFVTRRAQPSNPALLDGSVA